MIAAGIKFNWGLSGAVGPESILLAPSLLCYSGRNGVLAHSEHTENPEEKYAGWVFGGPQDQINIAEGGVGSLINRPVKTLFLARETNGCTVNPGVIYNIRIEYDIVTLTTSEQAELYQQDLCG